MLSTSAAPKLFVALRPVGSRSPGAGHTISAQVGKATSALWLWMERGRQRRALAELDDRLLGDIGLTRADARQECAKPIWAR